MEQWVERSRKKIKVAWLGYGPEPHYEKWFPALVNEGVEIHFIGFVKPAIPMQGVFVHELPEPSSRLRWYHFLLVSVRPLKTVLDSIKPDILISSFATTYGLLGKRSGRKPHIVQTWTRDATVVPWQGRGKWYFRAVIKAVLRSADVVFTDGPALAKEMLERLPAFSGKTIPLLWGVNTTDFLLDDTDRLLSRFQLGIPPDVPTVTFARGVRDWYQPEVLLEAGRMLLDLNPEVHLLVITGAQHRTAAVGAQLEMLARNPRVLVFNDRLDVGEMRTVWGCTDFLVSAPLFDGISEAVLEGMCAGCIPVVNRLASNRSFLEDGSKAVFLDEMTPGAVATTLSETIRQRDDLVRIKRPANRRWVLEHGDVSKTALRVYDTCLSLLEKDGPER